MNKYFFLELLWSFAAIIVYGIPFLFLAPLFLLILEKGNIVLLAFSIPVLFFFYILMIIFLTGILRIFIPPVKPGIYPLKREGEVIMWMLHAGIHNYIRIPGLIKIIHANPILRRFYYTLSGAKIHKSVIISYDASLLDPFFIEIGEDSKIGEWSKVSGHIADEKRFIFGKVKIGKRVLVGAECSIAPGVEIGDDSMIMAYSRVLPGTIIPPGELWGGTPARFKKKFVNL